MSVFSLLVPCKAQVKGRTVEKALGLEEGQEEGRKHAKRLYFNPEQLAFPSATTCGVHMIWMQQNSSLFHTNQTEDACGSDGSPSQPEHGGATCCSFSLPETPGGPPSSHTLLCCATDSKILKVKWLRSARWERPKTNFPWLQPSSFISCLHHPSTLRRSYLWDTGRLRGANQATLFSTLRAHILVWKRQKFVMVVRWNAASRVKDKCWLPEHHCSLLHFSMSKPHLCSITTVPGPTWNIFTHMGG